MRTAGEKPVLTSYPYLRFPSTWEVSIIAPYPYAEVRFLVRRRGSPLRGISVYLDTNDSLGCVGQPYWELYPYCDGDTRRFLLYETDKLIRSLRFALASGCST